MEIYMTNYLLQQPEGFFHYFYKKDMGIWYRRRRAQKWTEAELLYKEGHDGFCAYCDENGTVHVICTNDNHDTVYFVQREGEWHKYILLVGKPDIVPHEFALLSDTKHLNLFYTAIHKDEVILVHCILGANAQPSTIDKLSPAHMKFCLLDRKVYYTNNKLMLGYSDYADGKPVNFVPVAEGGYMPSGIVVDGKIMLTYKCRHQIYFNDVQVFEDFAAEQPVLVNQGGKLLLQWKSGSFTRYLTSFNGGRTWSTPMRFVNSSREAQLYKCPVQTDVINCYGSHSSDDLMLFGNPPIEKAVALPKYQFSEISNMKKMIDDLQKEIEVLKREIKDK